MPSSDRRPFVGGNWKMNTDASSAADLAFGVAEGVEGVGTGDEGPGVEVAVYVPFPYLLGVGAKLGNGTVRLGAQDISDRDNGAFTGEVSADMLEDCLVTTVLTGHSERRHVIGESDALVGAKTTRALKAGFQAVLCVGETLEQREAGRTDEINASQLEAGLEGLDPEMMERIVIAYEPVWAIGTGKTASPGDAQDAHAKIRSWLGDRFSVEIGDGTRIIYGGSVKPGNARELFDQPDIDGGLIGGASLDASGFLEIVRACLPE